MTYLPTYPLMIREVPCPAAEHKIFMTDSIIYQWAWETDRQLAFKLEHRGARPMTRLYWCVKSAMGADADAGAAE